MSIGRRILREAWGFLRWIVFLVVMLIVLWYVFQVLLGLLALLIYSL